MTWPTELKQRKPLKRRVVLGIESEVDVRPFGFSDSGRTLDIASAFAAT